MPHLIANLQQLARAVVAARDERHLPFALTSDVEELAANGMSGRVAGHSCTVGKLAFSQRNAVVEDAVVQAVERLGMQGATALVVTRDEQVIGVMGIADTLRESAAPTLAALESGKHPRSLEMLTGDNAYAARSMAAQVGIGRVSSELLPAGKLDRIGELQSSGEVVAMVGDGINDAPALAKADLGITMGAAASDTALEVADVALLSDSLEQLPTFFHLADRTMNVVKENIVFAIGVKLLVFVLVAMGVAGMGAAVFADTGVALLVVLNGMRLMRRSSRSW
jgi:Cd2+/Zn2+-exporting ATPase